MKCQLFPFFAVFFALAVPSGLTLVNAAGEPALDTATIEAVTGLKGILNQAEGTFKVSKPRNDVVITVKIFLHCYGRGKALSLAEGVRAAIDTQPLAANQSRGPRQN
jgi:hypothetical protein